MYRIKKKNELDQLLWDVLWKTLGLPRDIRKSFKLNNPQIDLIAVDNSVVIGGLVANWLSENEIEICHIAEGSDFQGLSVGKRLVEKLIKLVQKDSPVKIQTCARNTSVGFFTKLGFISTSEYQEHQDFARHGIKFQQMYLDVQ
ncbi:GNAT family N-acetyltransferase [Methanophagales archaeon]|nr:MAG: GNAT family N-acetyltransferase [Methanophagales archaeon]